MKDTQPTSPLAHGKPQRIEGNNSNRPHHSHSPGDNHVQIQLHFAVFNYLPFRPQFLGPIDIYGVFDHRCTRLVIFEFTFSSINRSLHNRCAA
jgi:hypothetical protein